MQLADIDADITYAIGDIHGNMGALAAAFDWIAEDSGRTDRVRIVTLGDYIDRGSNSRGVLDRLIASQERCNTDLGHTLSGFFARTHLVCLQGNHEDMMIGALSPETSEQVLDLWLINGGAKTLQNYAHEPAANNPHLTKHLNWMRKLPIYFEDRHRIYVHAGLVTAFGGFVSPADAMEEVNHRRAMKWMFVKPPEADYSMVPKLVVVGHTALYKPFYSTEKNVCYIDTGCGKGGTLTVAKFDDRPGAAKPVSFHPFKAE